MPSSPEPSSAPSFDESLAEVETALHKLKDRYAQVQRDRQRRDELRNRIDDIRRIPKGDRTPDLKDELSHIAQQLDDLKLTLESDLFTWSSLSEPFWQAVRFGGIGIVIGWLLKTIAG